MDDLNTKINLKKHYYIITLQFSVEENSLSHY
jgi:hypothetical protein